MAKNLGIPVVTTFMGRGLLTDSDMALQGTYLGVAGDPAITQLVERSDCLMLLGFHVYPQLPLIDLVNSLGDLAARNAPAKGAQPSSYPRCLSADDQAITPTDIATAVNDMFDAAGPMPIAADMGDCLFTALDIEYTHVVAPGYYATMGYGVPAGYP